MRSQFRYPLLAFALALAVASLPQTALHEAESEKDEDERGFDQPDEAMRWVLMGQRDEFGNIDPNGLLRAKAQMDAMRAQQARTWAARGLAEPSLAGINNNSWTWIGPGNIGGRTRAIAINPSDATNVFAGSVGGGIWRTFDSGGSWEVVDDFMANLAVTSILFKPGDPSTMFAATGEGYFNFDAIRGAGIFRSNNGGTNWSQLGSTNNSDFHYTVRLAFSADGSTLLAATRTGIFRSTDNGDSWNRQLAISNMMDVKFIPTSNTHAVAGGRSRNAFYSTDGGVSWTISPNLAGGSGRIELGVSTNSPNVVYASYDASPSGQIWKSVDFGVTYALTAGVTPDGHLGGQGWYDNVLWVDPANVNHVIASGVRRYRSLDGFASAVAVQMSGSIHVDHHAIVSHPQFDGVSNRQVYFGNDGGVYRLEDSNGTSFTRLNNNYGVTQFYGAGGHVASGRIVGGTQDNGTLVYTPAGGPQNWVSTFGGDGGFSAIDQTDANYVYGELQWLGVHRSTNGGGLNSSQRIDGCSKAAPYRLDDGCDASSSGVGTNFISPILLDPNEPNRLLAGAQRLWRTDDARTATTGSTGPSWAVIKTQTTNNSNISAIAVPSGNSDLVWIGHNNGDVYMTTSGTSPNPIWNLADAGLPNRGVNSIAITPANNNIVYAAFSGFNTGNLWRTTDGGGGWADRSVGLPSAPIRSVVVHPTNPDWIYVGTDVGVFASENAGATWQVPHDGPANVAVFQLFWMNTTLVAVTHGRGMFTANVVSTQPPVITLNPTPRKIIVGGSATFTAAASGTGITWQWQAWNGSIWFNLFDGAPYSGVTTPTLALTNTPIGLNNVQYRAVATNAGGSAISGAALLSVYASGANVLTNGDFSGGSAGWSVFEVPDIVWSVVSGVMQFFRASPTTTASGQAVVFQHSGVSLGPGTPISASFDLGNSSSVRKRLTVVILDSNFSDLHVCTFYLAPGAPMRTYQARTHSTQAWANAAIYFYAATGGSNGGNYLIDNVSLRYDTAASTSRTDCVDPTAPIAPGGAAGPNWLVNNDFGTGALAPWGTFGAITWQITGGVFQFYKPAAAPGTPAGVVLQNTSQAAPFNQILTATFQLGNSSAVRRRVTVLVHDGDFSDLVACTFWLTPSQALSTYSMRMFTTEAWTNATLSVYSATTGSHQWILFDNAVLQTTPADTALGTECFEPPPGPAPLQNDLGSRFAAFTAQPGETTPEVVFTATTLQKSERYRLEKPARVEASAITRR